VVVKPAYFSLGLFLAVLAAIAVAGSFALPPSPTRTGATASTIKQGSGSYKPEAVVGTQSPGDASSPVRSPSRSSVGSDAHNLIPSAEEYEAALAKWRSFGIDEYEMVVERGTYAPRVPGDGTYTVRVRRGRVEVVSFQLPYTGALATPPVNEEYLNGFDIDRQFESLRWLTNRDAAAAPNDEYIRYITFDAVYGYPSYFSTRTLRWTHGGGYERITGFRPLNITGSPVPLSGATPRRLP